jgi:hypothetical protein
VNLTIDVPQAVANHAVDELDVAHASAGAGGVVVVRGIGHALHATHHHHLRIAAGNRLSAGDHCLEAGAADLVDGGTGHRVGQPSEDRRLSGGGLSDTALKDATEEDLVHLLGIEAHPLQRGLDGDGAELGSGQGGEAALKGSDRGADS